MRSVISLQWNPPVLDWKCRLYNGRNTVVVMVVVVVSCGSQCVTGCSSIRRPIKPYSQQTNWTDPNWTELSAYRELEFANCSTRTAALQPINFVTLTRVTNNASCNWVNLVHVGSVHFVCSEHGLTGRCFQYASFCLGINSQFLSLRLAPVSLPLTVLFLHLSPRLLPSIHHSHHNSFTLPLSAWNLLLKILPP